MVGTVGAVSERPRATTRTAAVRAPATTTLPPVKPEVTGNRALSSLLGGIAVQRTGCGGSCGCGGTCGDEQESGEAVQRRADPTTAVAPAAPRRASSPPAHLLPQLQRRAGNAAVAQLVRSSAAPTTTPAPETVQRLDASDLLPSWISNAIFG